MYKVVYSNKKRKYEFIKNNKIISQSKTKIKLYNDVIKCANNLLKVSFKNKYLKIYGLLIVIDKYRIFNNNYFIHCNNKNYKTKTMLNIKIPLTNLIIQIYSSNIFYHDFNLAPITNPIHILFKDQNRYGFKKKAAYNIFKFNFKSSKIKLLNNNTSVYLKQTSTNKLVLIKRVPNLTDNKKYQLKIILAKFVSIFMSKNKILLFEKESYKYEESASVLYEKLIDLNYTNSYYIINKNSNQLQRINNKYKTNIIYKGSFKNYLYFFRCKTFLGTESIEHAIDLRVTNKHIEKFIHKGKYNFVFLQHGVMYMVSLSSKLRSFFKKENFSKGNTKIVVSSLTEANHFINDAGYDLSDLYITGLPKFDNINRYSNANKIVIMPTWRPWEYNEARLNPKNTTYYKMMMDIYNAIPNNLKNNVIMLPHPLFLSLTKNFEGLFNIPYNSYENVLKNTSILITDYSSIATDAFSRGCNVIFWWSEVDSCMQKYGGHLMINKNNTYGDICFSKEELETALINRYLKDQPENYIKNYNKIVEFNDNQNTERLINFLQQDNLI